MNTGLIVIYILTSISLLANAYMHGKAQEPYNFWIALLGKAITLTLVWWALNWRFI